MTFIDEPRAKLTRDLIQASRTLSDSEARFLVDAYYTMQDDRKRSDSQVRAIEGKEPNEILKWFADKSRDLENQIRRALDSYSAASPLGRWARDQVGIGPVIAAGLLAHIDITRAKTAGAIWRLAGLDPTQKWEKGQKRPWNAQLKTLTWKIGESFVKVCNNPDAYYATFYKERKERDTARNDNGDFAEAARLMLETRKIDKSTDLFKHLTAGRLAPAHIHARAKRYAVKMFLSHYHHVAFKLHFGVDPPKPFAIAILNHAHYFEPTIKE